MSVVVYVTKMAEIPSNCMECKLEFCRLPTLSRHPDIVAKKYMTRRPSDCPLRKIQSEHLGKEG